MPIQVVYTYTCQVPNCGVMISVPRSVAPGDIVPPATPPPLWTSVLGFLVCNKHKIGVDIDGAVVQIWPSS